MFDTVHSLFDGLIKTPIDLVVGLGRQFAVPGTEICAIYQITIPDKTPEIKASAKYTLIC